jgi:alpha-L-fucosidase
MELASSAPIPIEQFTASAYKPANWAHLDKEMGAKCTVLTARHHNGFAL